MYSIILGIVLNIPTGYLTIGDENSWVSFLVVTLAELLGDCCINYCTFPIYKREKNFKLSQRSFLSATTITMNYEQKHFGEKIKAEL